MANPSGRKGTDFESSILPLLTAYYGPETHRLGKQGAKDKGDFHLPGEGRYALEAKNEASYKGKLSVWIAEAKAEAVNKGAPWGVVVHKRKGTTAPGRQYVTLELDAFLALVREGK